MRSPWVDLLRLHGYIIDPRPRRKAITLPTKRHADDASHTLAKRVATSLRLCLGIGDGLVRSQ